MPDGTQIQERDINNIPSTRRNPIIADVFARLGYMERQGSGLSKICTIYKNAANYQNGLDPTFRSNRVEFTVILPNLNYKNLNEPLTYVQQLLLDTIRANPTISQKEICENSFLSRSTVQRTTKELVNLGIIKRIGSRKKGMWIIND